MIRARVIPVLLLKNDGLVKTIKFKSPKYIGDPLNAVKIFNEKEVDEIAIIDISSNLNSQGPNFNIIEEIASECFMPLMYGGGITTFDHINKLFAIGVEKISLNSILHSKPELVSEAAKQYGSQSIIASIDVKKNFFGKYEVITNSGKINSKIDPVNFAIQMQNLGVGEIFLNSIDRDGLMNGYDIDLILNITSKIDIPLIACGGARNIDDMKKALSIGNASAVAAGSMFVYHGKHNAVLINYLNQNDIKNLYE
jgi:cyclase